MSENSQRQGRSYAEEFASVKHLVDKFREEDKNELIESFLNDEGILTDPDTGKEYTIDYGLDFQVSHQLAVTFATGGPAVRALVLMADDQVIKCKLQHQDWFSEWEDVALTRDEEDALEWYLIDILNLSEWKHMI